MRVGAVKASATACSVHHGRRRVVGEADCATATDRQLGCTPATICRSAPWPQNARFVPPVARAGTGKQHVRDDTPYCVRDPTFGDLLHRGGVKKYSREDQRFLTIWGLDCAERVLPLFEAAAPDDPRPRHAIQVGREWVATGRFSMKVIRGASLAAHAAAQVVKQLDSACQAAHAAGQAVAAAHVAQHAYGGAFYALRALAASSGEDAALRVRDELNWQSGKLPAHLRDEIISHLGVRVLDGTVKVTLTKGPHF